MRREEKENTYFSNTREPEIIWQDRKHILGLPISSTVYSLSPDRLFVRTGLLRRKEERMQLVYIRDLVYTRGFLQKLAKLGTLKIISSDRSTPVVYLKSIKNAKLVRELLYVNIQYEYVDKNVRYVNMNGGKTTAAL